VNNFMNNQKILKFWSIPIFTVYFYAANILMQYGYISYFGIPSSFIEASIKDNILYFFSLSQVIFIFIGQLKWWIALLMILPIIIIFDICNNNIFWKKFFNVLLIILFVSSLWFSYKLGKKIAEINTNYLTLDSSCVGLNDDHTYIIPNIYLSKMILTPIDLNNKMIGGFVVKESSYLNCLINYKQLGPIKH